MLPERSRVVVAYSGGADSTCLLHLLSQGEFDLIVAHLHHGQRVEADEEAQRCAAFCDELGMPFVLGRADVPSLARDQGIGLEEAGRLARYEFLRLTALQTGHPLISTGHTRDDHVETMLLHLARGTGMAGMIGIAAVSGDLIRPLLPFTREETRGYCEQFGLWFHDDPANVDLDFSRARIRHRVLPELRKINSAADAALCRFGEICQRENAYLDGLAASALAQAEMPLNGDLRSLTADCEVAFGMQSMTSFPEVLVRRALRLASGYLRGPFDFDQIAHVVEGLTGAPGSITAEGGTVVAEWDRDRLVIRRLEPDPPYRHPLTVPGTTTDDLLGWSIEVQPWPPTDYQREPRALEVVLDPSTFKGPLYVRPAQVGDRIQPLHLEGTKLLSDVLREMHLTAAARARLPIVCDLVGPVWVPGGPLAERVAITSETRQAVRLRFIPEGA